MTACDNATIESNLFESDREQVRKLLLYQTVDLKFFHHYYSPPVRPQFYTYCNPLNASSIAMAHTIDMNDKNAWDDSLLQDSWNDAVAEYEASLRNLVTCSLPNLPAEVS